MKKDIKKALVISILSMGALSSAHSALCAPGDVNGAQRQPSKLGNDHIMIPAFRLSKTDLKNFLCVSKKTGSTSYKFKVNPVGISSRQDIQLFVPNIETFKDYHKLTPDEDRNNHVNSLNDGQYINTLIYYPQSFDAERFRTILEVNGVDVLTPTSRGTGLWKCEIKPFNGMYYRVEYNKKIEKEEKINKKIVFLFRPSNLDGIKINGNVVESFNRLLEDYGLRDAVDVNHTLQKFIIPCDVKSIGDNVFRECTSLKEIGISDSVTSIGRETFSGCKSLKEITIPNGVKSIRFCVFNGCESIKEITIPNGVTEIYSNAFKDCTSLKKVTIPNSVEAIDLGAFRGCTSLEKVKIPENVTEIGNFTFDKCKSLREIEISDRVRSIGNCAFERCESLKEITIPNSVIEMGYNIFNGCKSLEKVKILGRGVTNIGNYAFMGCNSLKEIEIPSSVGEIGYHAFDGCTSLEKIEMLSSVKRIGLYAFRDCKSLKEITIPVNVKKIAEDAFDGCTSLKIRWNKKVYDTVAEFFTDFNIIKGY